MTASKRRSGSSRTNRKNRTFASSKTGGAKVYGADYLTVLPGALLCLMTLVILLMDAAVPAMEQDQYEICPNLFRMVNLVICAGGILYWILFLKGWMADRADRADRWSAADRTDGTGRAARRSLPGRLVTAQPLCVLFFGAFCLWMLLSTAVNGLDEEAIHGVSFRDLGVFHLIALFAVYLFLSAKLERGSFRRGLLLAYLGTADLIGIAAVLSQYVHRIPAFTAKKELSAIFFNGNHYGYFLTMAVLIGLGIYLYRRERGLRLFGLLSMGFQLLLLMLNDSFGCLLAVGAAMILLLLVSAAADRQTALRLLVIMAILAAAAAAGTALFDGVREAAVRTWEDLRQIRDGGEEAGSAGHNRWMLWTLTGEYIAQRPWLGYGNEGISSLLLAETGRGNPHCELLSYGAYFGIPGAALYLAGMLAVFAEWLRRKVWQDPEAACGALAALGYFVSSCFGVPMFYTLPFFFVFLGLSLSRER